MKKLLTSLLLTTLLLGVLHAEKIDWRKAVQPRKGVRYVCIEKVLERKTGNLLTDKVLYSNWPELKAAPKESVPAEQRLLKGVIMKVDLTLPGLGFTGLERDPDWGQPMPDHHPKNPNVQPNTIRTRRVTTTAFMLDRRKRGLDMIVASNSAPWSPWESPFNHKYANPAGLQITDGAVVADNNPNGKRPMLIIWKNGTIDITDTVTADQYDKVWFAQTGFGIIMRDRNGDTNPHGALEPRLAFALSKDRKSLFLLTVDGRQPGWSNGANMKDLCDILLDAGACDALNMDGGGSTTLCYWDDKAQKPVVLSHPTSLGSYLRPCGNNMGLYLKKK